MLVKSTSTHMGIGYLTMGVGPVAVFLGFAEVCGTSPFRFSLPVCPRGANPYCVKVWDYFTTPKRTRLVVATIGVRVVFNVALMKRKCLNVVHFGMPITRTYCTGEVG